MALPHAVRVVQATADNLDVEIRPDCVEWLERWCTPPSSAVIPITREGTVVRLKNECAVQNNSYIYTDAKLKADDWCMLRVRPRVQCIGSTQHKMVLTAVDAVLLPSHGV